MIEGETDASFTNYFYYSTELAFQTVGKEIREEAIAKGIEIADSQFPSLFRTACNIAHNGYCRMIMPLMLLDNFFESSSLALCEKMWNVLITMQDEIQQLISKNSNAGFALLNIVNSLLRRTSKMKDGAFRGSVMM